MSKRTDRLNARATELRTNEHVANVRLRNAEHGLANLKVNYPPAIPNAFHLELEAAREALREIHREQQAIITELDRHTVDLPNLALVLVDDPNGPRVIERRDVENTGTDETDWFELGAPDTDRPMSFDTAIGVTSKNPGGHEFYRLYTQDEVDDILDATLDAALGL